jgi:hypothetical protein
VGLAVPRLSTLLPPEAAPASVTVPSKPCHLYERCEGPLSVFAKTQVEVAGLDAILGDLRNVTRQKQVVRDEMMVLGTCREHVVADVARLRRLFGGPNPLFTSGAWSSGSWASGDLRGQLEAQLGPGHQRSEVAAALGPEVHVLSLDGTDVLKVQFKQAR